MAQGGGHRRRRHPRHYRRSLDAHSGGEGGGDGGDARGDRRGAAHHRRDWRHQHAERHRCHQTGEALRRRRRAGCDALLREAIAGGSRGALHADRRRCRPAHHPVQRARPHRRRHVDRDDHRTLAPPDDLRAQGCHRRQRSRRADARHLRRRLPPLLGRGRRRARVRARRRRWRHLSDRERRPRGSRHHDGARARQRRQRRRRGGR
mmetsp:Transcript_54412/g.125377  ORF Transcript_54412/g.125377 Transcript_54412/m.125377 type:complete len:206 (-) Transcript_54412:903-1520(-)